MVKFVRSALEAQGFTGSWVQTWHCLSDHAEVAFHITQPEGPTTMYGGGGGFGEKKEKKKKIGNRC